jgi:hypothetical protein
MEQKGSSGAEVGAMPGASPIKLLAQRLISRAERSNRGAKPEILLHMPESVEQARGADPEQLDAERRQADRQAKRCDDFDPTAPSYVDWAASRIPESSPARNLIRTCREYGVGLRLDPDGTLVVESKGRAWRGLVAAIEAHVDDVAALVAQGWDGTDS